MEQTKRILAVVLAFVLSISLLPAAGVSAASKKVKLNKTKATIYVGKTVTLKVKNTKKKVKWSTSNKKVATVTKKGKVKGKKAGKATITAKVGKKKYQCKITVKKKGTSKPATKPIEQPTTKSMQQTATKPAEQETVPIEGTEGKNQADVQVITNIINEQKALGAEVDTDLDSDQYRWETDESGEERLVGIKWSSSDLKEEISFAGLEKLTTLDCDFNELAALDVSGNKELTTLDCSLNELTALDVSKNTELTGLYCDDNQLTTLDVSLNTQLSELRCDGNRLTDLDVSRNTELTYLDCRDNQLTTLDLSQNTQLIYWYCDETVNVIGYEGNRGVEE